MDVLLRWAVRLTRGERHQAEDLLHEAFIQIHALEQLDFSGVEDIDSYLYTLLKHFHLSSIRRARRDPLSQLSLVEFDSVELGIALQCGLRSGDGAERFAPGQVCAFLCWRKITAKSASYLILRFFHGYYPEERRIAPTSRDVVDNGIRLAAGEAKSFLADPERLRFMARRAEGKRNRGAGGQADSRCRRSTRSCSRLNSSVFLTLLTAKASRRAVPMHVSQESNCSAITSNRPLPAGKIAPIVAASVDRTILAHLVSCPPCLDAVNRSLGMPPLSDRFAGERLGYHRPTAGEWKCRAQRPTDAG